MDLFLLCFPWYLVIPLVFIWDIPPGVWNYILMVYIWASRMTGATKQLLQLFCHLHPLHWTVSPFISIHLFIYLNNFPITLSANITAQSGSHPRVFPMVFLCEICFWGILIYIVALTVSKTSSEPQMWKVFLVSCLGSWLFLTWFSCKVKNVGECSIILHTTSPAFYKMSTIPLNYFRASLQNSY